MSQSPEMQRPRRLAIVLAAGEGTRMKSARAKVLHRVAGRTMLAHVLACAGAAGAEAIAVVVGPGREDVAAEAKAAFPGAEVFVQTERLGTAHAVLAARPVLERACYDEILVLCADIPLVEPQTLQRLAEPIGKGAALAVLGFEAADPSGYGRLIVEAGQLTAIREHSDANEAERAIRLCNAGLLAFAGRHALDLLLAIGNRNAQREFYLTDAVALARAGGLETSLVLAEATEIMGVNDRVQLAAAETLFQSRQREAVMRAGATLIGPETIFFSYDTKVGRDVIIGPNVVFGPAVSLGDNAVIHPFCHLEGADIGAGSSIGPFARLRPGSRIGDKVKIGNFVETKGTSIATGSKVNHLSYIGDSEVGPNVNIGAGAITCNYDGFLKHRTEIGEGAFIGTNASLVAPLRIGANAYIGSGSVVTEDVPDEALAIGRGKQINKPGWSTQFRARQAPRKGGQK
jgi:bifunctional UDP-N-acetylglucosamine pyrophosphorylase/glucosamine-1-phosphate N-acetyltransferase